MKTLNYRSVVTKLAVALALIAAVFAAAPAGSAAAEPIEAAAVSQDIVESNDASTQAWECIHGYPCLYDYANGQGTVLMKFSCGWHNLYNLGSNYQYANWADSIRTFSNSVTVWNWNSRTRTWENYGTVPPDQPWNFAQPNVIDAITVNC